MKKRILSALLVSAMMLALAACNNGTQNSSGNQSDSNGGASTAGSNTGSSPESTGWVPKENIEMVIPFSAGGGSGYLCQKNC